MIPRRRYPFGLEVATALLAAPFGRANRDDPVAAFEREAAAFLDTPHAIATASGRDALALALDALQLRPGDELIIPGYTLGELLPALQARGLVLVPADIDPATFNITAESVADRITPRTRAILAVHLFGAPCDIAAIAALARTRDLALVEDCAHAFGARIEGRAVGSFGDAALFSLEPNKPVAAFGGGLLVTTRDDVAAHARAELAGRPRREWDAARRILRCGLEELLVRSPLYGPLARLLFHPRIAAAFERRYRQANAGRRKAPGAFTRLQARIARHRLPRLEARNERLNRLAGRLAGQLPPGLALQRRDRDGAPAFYSLVARHDGDPAALRQRALRAGIDLAIGSEIMDDTAALLGLGGRPASAGLAIHAVQIPLHDGITERRLRHMVRVLERLAGTTDERVRPPASPVVLVRVDRDEARSTAHPRHLHPPLELKSIQAALEASRGAPVPLVDHWLLPGPVDAVARRVLAHRPRIAVIKGLSWCIDEAVTLGRTLRRHGIVTVAVGQHATHARLAPMAGWDDAFDLTVAGEPEAVTPKLVDELLAGADAAALDARLRTGPPALVETPDDLPRPTFTADELDNHPFPFPVPGRPVRRWGHLQSSWGCPSRCLHCTEMVRKSVGWRFRTRSPERVVDDIAALVAAGCDGIVFEDDSLLADRRHFLALCEAIVERGLQVRWIASVRPDQIDAESAAAAASAGAALFKVGLETGSPRQAEQIGKCRDGAGWPEIGRRAIGQLNAYGIGSVGLLLAGLPGENDADVDATIRLAIGAAPSYIQVQRFTAYPDVQLDMPTTANTTGYHYPVGDESAEDAGCLAQRRIYRAFYLRLSYMLAHVRRFGRHYLRGGLRTRAIAALGFLVGR